MSVDFTQEEWQKTVNFLEEFTTEYPCSSAKEDNLPLRVTPRTVRNEELFGCLIEWTLECLRKCNCPEVLATIMTHHATKDVLDNDLSSYKLEDSEDLEMEKIARDTFSSIQKLCTAWHKETPKLHKSNQSYPSCVHAIKNTRRKMEDKHVILPDFNNLMGLHKGYPDLAFFAVYDGHAGADAAIYTATHFHSSLAKNKNLSTDPGQALFETFHAIDEAFEVKAKAEGLKSGCTAVTVLISDNKMFVAWLGDSQVVLCKGGECVSLMEPHKPDNQEERERIEALGGCVVYFGAWRVNGSLSVSRAIGDVEHKPFISSEPCISEYIFEGDEEFIILACDGLWDTVGRDQAIELVRNHMSSGNDRGTAAKLLVDTAKSSGSSDNISVVVVYLDAHVRSCHNVSLRLSTEEVTSPNQNNSSFNKVLTNEEQTSPPNGDTTDTSESACNSVIGNGKANCSVSPHVHIVEKKESHESIVAKVKVSSESSKTGKTKSVTCKVTNEKYESCSNGACSSGHSPEKTSKSADNSPNMTKKSKPAKSQKGSHTSKGAKGKSSNQLDVGTDANPRRKSAPAVPASSSPAKT